MSDFQSKQPWHHSKAIVSLFFVLLIFFRNKLGSEDEIKIKFIRTIFQLNQNQRKHDFVFPSILIQLENGFYF